MEKISGTLESILFTDSHSQETFAKIRIPYKRSLIVIKGRFSDSFFNQVDNSFYMANGLKIRISRSTSRYIAITIQKLEILKELSTTLHLN